jgi:preprotein translocase subunit SecB
MNKKVAEEQNTTNDNDNSKPAFAIQRIYVKDISYEAPNTPATFKSEWVPKVDLNLDISTQKLSENVHEVVLKITATVSIADKIAFLVEIHQAGIFSLQDFSHEQLEPLLGSFCPNILFPYARELISETISRGGFPPLYLAPVNFDALYQQKHKNSKNKH